MPVANAVAGVTLSDQTMSQTATAERLDDVDADNPRIVTRAVADRYASNTLNRPQYRVGDTDISVVNGTPLGGTARSGRPVQHDHQTTGRNRPRRYDDSAGEYTVR